MEKGNETMDFDGLYNMILEEQAEEAREKSRLSELKENESGEIVHHQISKDNALEAKIFKSKKDLIASFAKAVEFESTENKHKVSQQSRKRKPVWHDSDDEEYKVGEVIKENKKEKFRTVINPNKPYKEYLSNKYSQIIEQPKWANLDRNVEDVDSDEELLKTIGYLGRSTSSALPANNINYKKLKDLNRDTYAESVISSIQFHPTSTAALVTGVTGVATIYAIDGKRNEKLHNIKFQKFPIKCAKLLNTGTEAILGGSRHFLYSYDLVQGKETRVLIPKTITKVSLFEVSPCDKFFAVAGRFGEVHLMDIRSKEPLHTYKQEYPCTAIQFSNDSRKIFTHSDGPQVNVFDIRNQKIEHCFLDEGCINGTTLALSGNGKMLATGSKEGVVNIYNYDDIFMDSAPRPMKTIYNLRTSISTLKFNHSSEILGVASDSVSDAVKLIHFPSGTVFANFPGFKANIGKIRVLEFSPNSGYMALGNKSKEVPLYRLKHFNNY